MTLRSTLLVSAIAVALPGIAAAQFAPPPQGGSPVVQDRWPEAPKPQQSQSADGPATTSAPKPKSAPGRPAQAKASNPLAEEDISAPEPAPKRAPPVPANIVVCNGVFAKGTGHMKLAQRFDSRNITFGEVEGPDGSRINASILYPNDPKRRLEVLWSNESARSDVSVIAINGKSQWSAPKGLKLGLAIAAIEKLNGRPFKLSGFGKDNTATVLSWEGGALTSLPGGCKVGIRLFEDAKSADAERAAVAGDKELLSNEPAVRAVKPAIGEILIGY